MANLWIHLYDFKTPSRAGICPFLGREHARRRLRERENATRLCRAVSMQLEDSCSGHECDAAMLRCCDVLRCAVLCAGAAHTLTTRAG